MEEAILIGSLIMAVMVSWALQWFLTSIWQRKRLPPGPFPLPFVGNLLHLHGIPHRSMADLAKVHGPLMTLELGFRQTVVISSAQVAREMFLQNDLTFSTRSIPDAARALDHDKLSLAWIPPTQPWRDLRRFYNSELFTPHKLDANGGLRLKKVRELMEFVGRCSEEGRIVDIGRVAMTTTLNLICNTVFSVDLVGHGEDSSQEFKEVIWGVMEEIGKPNVSDYFPVLRWIDPQGTRRRLNDHFKKLDMLFDEMIEKRKRRNILQGEEEAGTKDVLDAFLSSKFDMETIKSTFIDIFVAGTDTSSNTVEWAMAELMRNSDAMARVKSELANSIPQGKEVDESDLPHLPYLQAVVKETFRMHPVAPLLLPRQADKSVELCGYMVPKHTQVIVNVWAIGQDLDSWTDPSVFKPERFLVQGKGVDFRGRDFELIPFGAGRRICPGLPLAFRMVHLTLASLLRSFHWKLPEDNMPSDIDMSERFGLTVSMANPLMVIPSTE